MKFYEMFNNAKWITPDAECANPYIGMDFTLENVCNAIITVSGLGFYQLFLNNERVSDDLFVTLSTDYHKRDGLDREIGGHRIICQQYDITKLLKCGKNTIGLLLGNGYYNIPNNVYYGSVKAIFSIKITDESGNVYFINSSSNAKWKQSFIIESENFLKGEKQDYALKIENWCAPQCDAAAWRNVKETEIPQTEYFLMDSPADKIIRHIAPTVFKEKEDTVIYDMGENITGWPILQYTGNTKGVITVDFSETIDDNGELNKLQSFGQRFVATVYGGEKDIHPELTWMGFRYAEVSKNAKMVDCCVIHSDVDVVSAFKSTDKVLNWLYESYIRTQLNNMHAGIPTDCPTLERRGYTGDGQLCCEAAMLLLDGEKFFRKWIYDISDCQDLQSGNVQHTAPFIPSGGGPGGWGCAIVEVPYMFYKVYGDIKPAKDLYPQMVKYIEFLLSKTKDNLIAGSYNGDWCLGDWACGKECGKIDLPTDFVNNFFAVRSINRMLEISEIIGNEERVTDLRGWREAFICGINSYFDAKTGDFCGNVQGSNAFAIELGLGDERTLKNLVSHYEELNMFDTGIFGTDVLLKVLFENGCGDTAYKLMVSNGEQSFGSQLERGETTICEYWTGERSHDHPMFGACARYLFKYILGIKTDVINKTISVSPFVPCDGAFEGAVKTKLGEIAVSVTSEKGMKTFVITIPNGCKAVFDYMNYECELTCGENRIIV